MVAKFFGAAYCMVGSTGFSRHGGQAGLFQAVALHPGPP